MRKPPVIIVAITLIFCCSNVVFGFDPMGPPKATLSKEEPAGRLEYAYSRMDIASGNPFGIPSVDIEEMEFNKIYVNLGYGFTDGWEVFVRLGAASANVDEDTNIDNYGALIGTSNFNVAAGVGAKVTFYESKDFSVGLLAQVSYTVIDDFNGNDGILFDLPSTLSTKLEMMEVQVALGPTWNCTEWLSIYGGPFLHFIDGEIKMIGTHEGIPGTFPYNTIIDQSNIFGGYVGANLRFSKSPNINCNIEFQATGAGYAAAIQLAISP